MTRAWSGVCLAATGVLLAGWVWAAVAAGGTPEEAFAGIVLVGSVAVAGHLIVRLRPGNHLGTLLQALAGTHVVVILTTAYRDLAAVDGTEPPLLQAAMLVDFWTWALPMLGLPLVLLWFPDGRPPVGWRWVHGVLVVGLAGFVLSRFIPVDLADDQDLPALPNPTGVPGAGGFEAAIVTVPVAVVVALLAAAVATAIRYARAAEAERRQLRWSTVGAGIAATLVAGGLVADAAGRPQVAELTTLLVPPLLMAALVVAVLRVVAHNEADNATEAERGRLRRDLHDGLGSSLTGIRLSLAGLAARSPELQDELTDLQADVELAQSELHRLVDDLAPAALVGRHLSEALDDLAASFRDAGLEVSVEIGHRLEQHALPAPVEVTLYRVASEAVANAAKHADARVCRVRLDVEPDDVRLTVADDGRGLDPSQVGAGVGLGSMLERVREAGGELSVAPTAGGGTTVCARLPRRSA